MVAISFAFVLLIIVFSCIVGFLVVDTRSVKRELQAVKDELRGKVRKMRIAIPVECQNGHCATWYIRIDGLCIINEGVPADEQCGCPKQDLGEGYHAIDEPFEVEEG